LCEALRVGGTRFSTVFLVLVILAVAISLIGLAVRRTSREIRLTAQRRESRIATRDCRSSDNW